MGILFVHYFVVYLKRPKGPLVGMYVLLGAFDEKYVCIIWGAFDIAFH